MMPSIGHYRPIPTTQSSNIRLNGTPNNHIITYGILTSLSKCHSSMSACSLFTQRVYADVPSRFLWPDDKSTTWVRPTPTSRR